MSVLPNFVIIGAQKSATRWLRDVLAEHPAVFTATAELEFFNHHYDRGLAWYAKQFTAARDATAIGEATPGYMMLTDLPARSAARIDGALPDVKVIAVLRNPLDRLSSAFVHHARMGRLESAGSVAHYVATIDPETDRMGLITGGLYARSLRPYVDRFGDRLLVLQHGDIKTRPASVYADVCRHIGVDELFKPKALVEVRHSNRGDVSDDVLARARMTADERKHLFQEHFDEDVRSLADMLPVDVARWIP